MRWPTGALDTNTGYDVLELLQDMQQKTKISIVMVTHNNEIRDIATKIINIRDGKVESIGINENQVKVSSLR